MTGKSMIGIGAASARMAWAWLLLAGLLVGDALSQTRTPQESVAPPVIHGCLGQQPEAAGRIERMTARGEFALADGRILRPLGIVMARSSASGDQINRQQPLWQHHEIELVQLSSSPDRWGRHAGWASASSIMAGHDPLPLTLALLGDGLGLADPSEIPAACRPALLKAEAEARRTKRGIWRDSSAVIDANTPHAEAIRLSGQFALLEGRVLRVAEGRQRHFIDFGLRGSGAASAAMPRRNMAMVLPSGVTLASLKGKRVRLRGILEWQADRPYMLLETAAMIEVLD